MKLEIIAVGLGACLALPFSTIAATTHVDLGTVDSFAVIAGSTVTNTGDTNLFGNLGVWPGTAIVGFLPGIVSGGVIHAGDAVALQAQTDLTTAYNAAAGQACDSNLSGQDLAGMTLTPGVYCFDSSAQLSGALTLDFQGVSSSAFVFQIGSTLTTASASSVGFVNGGFGGNLYWQVGSSATLGTTTQFAGNILALTSITLHTNANIECGRALARNGAVTMDDNNVNSGGCFADTGGSGGSDVPEPGTLVLLSGGLLFCLLRRNR